MIQVNRSRFNSTARRKQFAARVKEKWTHRSRQHSLIVERQHAVGDGRKGCVLLIPIRGLQEENKKKVNSWTHQTTTHGKALALGVWAWAAAFTPVIWTRLESKAWRHPNAPSVCCTSRPQLYVLGSRWCKVESNLNQAWIKCLMSLSLQTYHLPAALSDHRLSGSRWYTVCELCSTLLQSQAECSLYSSQDVQTVNAPSHAQPEISAGVTFSLISDGMNLQLLSISQMNTIRALDWIQTFNAFYLWGKIPEWSSMLPPGLFLEGNYQL